MHRPDANGSPPTLGPVADPGRTTTHPAHPSPAPVDFTRLPPDAQHEVSDGYSRLSISALPPHMRDMERRRESRQDSEDQAAGIFDLYDTDTDAEAYAGADRDVGSGRQSWSSAIPGFGSGDQRASVDSRRAGDNALHRDDDGREAREELREPDAPASGEVSRTSRGSQGSWEGPFSALSDPNTTLASPNPGTARHSATSTMGPANGHAKEPEQQSRPLSTPTKRTHDIPPITVTPDKSALAHVLAADGAYRDHQRDSSLSASTSTTTSLAPSPKTLSVNRLSPSPAKAVRGNGSANTSQVSVAASSQYPGEDNDAFYVRSTYARLEAEGVHGDGWDPGVERTRGGPAHGKRATVFEANRMGDVGEAEREFLANLDRYGFVNEPLRNRSETRLALIPTAPLLKVPKLPTTSPIPPGTPVPPPPAFDGREGPAPRSPAHPKTPPGEIEKQRRKEAERVGKWMKMMSVKKRDQGGNTISWGWKEAEQAKVFKRVYKGVPDRWRMAAWWTMAEDTVGRWKGKGRETRSAEQLADEYKNHIDLPSTHDVQIDLDVPRTISGHTLFVTRYGAGQRSLFHVLHCFSLLCETCGYCQGMGPIAATLLCYFDPERVYSLMVRLHDVYGMHSIFAPGFPGLLEAFYVQERLMEYLMPDVYKSFQRNMISSSAWGTKWYITLFVNTLPFSQQLRLWDALWLEGRDVMIITSIAILWSFKDLLAAPTANFESILSLLSSYFVAEDEDVLMRFIRKMLAQPGLRPKMDRWREEWAGLVRDGKSGQALL